MHCHLHTPDHSRTASSMTDSTIAKPDLKQRRRRLAISHMAEPAEPPPLSSSASPVHQPVNKTTLLLDTKPSTGSCNAALAADRGERAERADDEHAAENCESRWHHLDEQVAANVIGGCDVDICGAGEDDCESHVDPSLTSALSDFSKPPPPEINFERLFRPGKSERSYQLPAHASHFNRDESVRQACRRAVTMPPAPRIDERWLTQLFMKPGVRIGDLTKVPRDRVGPTVGESSECGGPLNNRLGPTQSVDNDDGHGGEKDESGWHDFE